MNTNNYTPYPSEAISLKLLGLYAFHVNPLPLKILQRFADKHATKKSEVFHLSNELYRKRFLHYGEYEWENNHYNWQMSPEHCLPLYLLVLDEHPEWFEEYQSLFKAKQKEHPLLQLARQMQQPEQVQTFVLPFTQKDFPYLLPAILDRRFYPYLNLLPYNLLYSLFDHGIVNCCESDTPEKLDHLRTFLQQNETLPPVQHIELKEMMALYRYYAFGEYIEGIERQTLFGLLLEAAHALYAGHYKPALKYYAEALKIRNRHADEKNVLVGVFNCYLLVMAYVKEGSSASLKKLEQLLKKNSMMHYSCHPAACIGHYFQHPKRQMRMEKVKELLQNHQPALRLFGYLFANYIGDTSIIKLPDSDFLPKQALLRHELSAYLPLAEEEKAELTRKMGGAPLLSSIYVKQAWEMVLENLLEKEKQSETSSDTRMMYLFRNTYEIEPREQTKLKSGSWGAGKVISGSRYASGDLECMDETDRNIWRIWRKSGQYRLTPEIVLPELAGSNRLYTGRNAPFSPVTVTQETPYLVLEKHGNRFKVVSNFQRTEKANRYESPTHIILQKDSTHYVTFPLQGKQRNVYQQLLEQQYFPLEAETKLKEFFQKMGNQIEVHSSLLDDDDALELVEGQATLCLQVRPDSYRFRILVYAQPLPGGNNRFVPGQGIGLAIDEKDGVRYQVKRKLRQEKANFEALAYFIEENCEATFQQNAVILSLEQMLDLLEYLRPLDDTYFLEWPEGEKLRLKGANEPKEWNIALKSDRNWFDIEGEIHLDDDTLLSVAQLLELVGNSRGKYIRLNEKDFLFLNDNLRKQLARLEAITVKQHGKMQLTAFQAGLLGNDILEGELTIQTDQTLQKLREKVAESQTLQTKVPRTLKATLRGYQQEGFQWMARLNSWGAGACLADDMGLGKTLQSIAYLLHMARKGPSLVLAPASVVANWRKELARFAPTLNVHTLNDSSDRATCLQKAKKGDVVLSSYGLLLTENEGFAAKKWNVVCLDEAHSIKNRDTKTSSCVMQLQAENRLILTGTPIQNHLGELWNLFQFINPGLLGSYEHFQQKFIQPIEQEQDKQRQMQLNRIVHPFMLRRTKQEVVEELPDKEEVVIPVELSDEEMAVYEVIRQRAKQLIEEGGEQVNVVTLAEITRLRQAACCASLAEKGWKGKCSKIDQLLELMAELKEGGNRALIFSQFTSFFQLIRKALDQAGESYLYLDGSVPVKKREKLVQEFQEGDCPFFLISLKAGGLGLNLTAANYIIHLDPWWNPAIEQQATDRAYRIGQTQKVTAYHLIASHTIEEKIMRLHQSKRNLADALLEGSDMSHKLTAQELMKILEQA